MKKTLQLFSVALLGGVFALVGYVSLVKDNATSTQIQNANPVSFPTAYNTAYNSKPITDIDFTAAAEKTIHAVVHVTNTTRGQQTNSLLDFFYGGSQPRMRVGTGSGVIISPDGYVITNNHVIENASELIVTLNNNKTYTAELVGTDPKTDIALLKINSESNLPYIPFADSNDIKVGEWVLAVGNPFNLNSTVTAGIVSAKARDLNEFDRNPQAFIQTDAAVNRGNSGGALVNTRGELIGINTAITSETGSYVGYSFAVPSNTARKVVEDLLEYGNVQRGILGIFTEPLQSERLQRLGVSETEGVYISGIESGSGADVGGLQEGDIIKALDGYKISKFSDLTGYLSGKRPKDVVRVTLLREGNLKTLPVTLVKLDTYEISPLGLEVKDATEKELKQIGASNGVRINRALNRDMAQYGLSGAIITKINNKHVNTVDDVKKIMANRAINEPIKLTYIDAYGETSSIIFR